MSNSSESEATLDYIFHTPNTVQVADLVYYKTALFRSGSPPQSNLYFDYEICNEELNQITPKATMQYMLEKNHFYNPDLVWGYKKIHI